MQLCLGGARQGKSSKGRTTVKRGIRAVAKASPNARGTSGTRAGSTATVTARIAEKNDKGRREGFNKSRAVKLLGERRHCHKWGHEESDGS